MVMVYATGHLSGAHINPAVTIAFTLTRHFPARDAVVYIAAQLAGATAGALLSARGLDRPARGSRRHGPDASGREARSSTRCVLTAFLMFVIMAVATDTRAVGAAAAIAIGGTVGLDALFGGPVTGASMNPARSFGPALAAGEWTDFWIYVVGPLAGAALGAFAYQLVRGRALGSRGRLMARVLFVCLHNAGRSQMSEALFTRAAGGAHEARSAGTRPSERVHPEVVEVMRELDIDLSGRVPPQAHPSSRRIGRRRRDDGLRRRVPLHPRQALSRLGARSTPTDGRSTRSARRATRSSGG